MEKSGEVLKACLGSQSPRRNEVKLFANNNIVPQQNEQERKQVPLELRAVEAAGEMETRNSTTDLVALSSGS